MPCKAATSSKSSSFSGVDLALDHLEIQADEAVRILDGAAL